MLTFVGYVKLEKDSWSQEMADALMPGAEKVCHNSHSLFEALLDLTEYIAQAIAIYQTTGDLYEAIADRDNGGLSYELAVLTSNHDKYRIGVLSQGEDAKTDDEHYHDIREMCTRLKRIMKKTKNVTMQNYLSRELVTMEKARVEVYSSLERSPNRIQPFTIYLNGKPGAGKSELMDKLNEVLIRSVGIEYDSRKIYNRNCADKYWSKFKSDCLVVNFNDVGASKNEETNSRQYEEMLRVSDVARFFPAMPEAHEKGSVDLNNLITTCSGNGIMPMLGAYVNDTRAYSRRYPLVPYVRAKEDFCAVDATGNHYICSAKVKQARKNGTLTGEFDEVVDIFLFESKPTKMGIEAVPITINGKHRVSVAEFVAILTKRFIAHLEGERDKLERKEKVTYENYDHVTAYESLFPNAPLEDMEVVHHMDSPIMEEINGMQQYVNEARQPRRRYPRNKPVPYNLTQDEMIEYEAARADDRAFALQEHQVSELRGEAMLWQDMSREKLDEQLEEQNAIIRIAQRKAAFDRRWRSFPRVKVPRWIAPEAVWNAITPNAACDIDDALAQNLTVVTASSAVVAFGPMIFFAPAALCIFAGISVASVGTVAAVSVADNLHSTALTSRQRIFVMSNWRKVSLAQITGVSAAIILACQVYRTMRRNRDSLAAEGEEFTPTPMDDPFYRNLGAFPWNKEKPMVDRTHLGATSKTTISDDLLPIIARNNYAGDIYRDGEKVGTIIGQIPCSGYMIVTAHYITRMRDWLVDHPGTRFTLVMRCGEPKKGHCFKCEVDVKNCYYVTDSDSAILMVNETGDRKNIIKHFPIKREASLVTAVSMCRKPREEATQETVRVQRVREVEVPTVGKYIGFEYIKPGGHAVGMCGSPVIAAGGCSHIIGFHAAGSTKQANLCIGSIVTQHDITEAIKHYRLLYPHAQPLLPECSMNLSTQVRGFKVEEPHYKSALRYTTDDAQFTVVGTTTKRATFKSQVTPSCIRDTVGEVCGVDTSKYVPPVSKPSWFGPQENADAIAVSGQCFPAEALKWAYEDYMRDVKLAAIASKHEFRPLTDFEVLNGTCKLYEEPMNRASVWGEPFEGPKSEMMFENPDPSYRPYIDYEGPIWDVKQDIKDFVKEYEAKYKVGEPIRPLFTSCIKDEVHYNKKKARVFEVAPMPITYTGRKLTLKTSSFMRLNSTITECMVGTNCHGPDSTLIYDHMTKFGTDRIIAGDFSKYDKRMPVSLLRAGLQIYRDLAHLFWPNDSEKESNLKALDAWIYDVTYATINYFGDVIVVNTGDFPSGINITADVNSGINSLKHRCVYYVSYVRKYGFDKIPPPFRKHVALGTYGDDSGGSVSKDCDWFDMKVMSDICAEFGIKYTDPEKSATTMPFYPEHKFEFLKRNFSTVHECGYRLGALVTESIYKPLCLNVWSPKHCFNKEELAAETVMGSMNEAFNHGRDFYDNHQRQMLIICERHNLGPKCSDVIKKSFDQKLLDWHELYRPQVEYLSRRK